MGTKRKNEKGYALKQGKGRKYWAKENNIPTQPPKISKRTKLTYEHYFSNIKASTSLSSSFQQIFMELPSEKYLLAETNLHDWEQTSDTTEQMTTHQGFIFEKNIKPDYIEGTEDDSYYYLEETDIKIIDINLDTWKHFITDKISETFDIPASEELQQQLLEATNIERFKTQGITFQFSNGHFSMQYDGIFSFPLLASKDIKNIIQTFLKTH